MLSDAELQALIVGNNPLVNLANNRACVLSGSIARSDGYGRNGTTAWNVNGTGDVGATVVAAGSDVFVDWWYGYVSGGKNTLFMYLFGDYPGSGSTGYGIATRHSGISDCWGIFNGSTLNSSGELYTTLFTNTPQLIMVTREVASGVVKVYRNGVLKITSTLAPLLHTNWAVGSIGQNQYGSLGSDVYTLMAGRLRGKFWTAAQARVFADNPWQIFESEEEWEMVQAAGDGSANGTLTATLGAITLGATGATPIAAAAAQTLGSVTLAAAGGAVVTGSLARTLGDVTLAATGGAVIAGAMAGTLGPVTLVASAGAGGRTGSAAVTLGAVGLAAAVAVPTSGAAALQLQRVQLTAGANLAVAGAAALFLGKFTLSANAISGDSEPIVVPPSRTVNFAGGISRVDFGGGTNSIDFDGGINNVTFDGGTNSVAFAGGTNTVEFENV